jgi:hypothetical protein
MVLQLPSTATSETYVTSTEAAEKKSARLLNKAAELGCSSECMSRLVLIFPDFLRGVLRGFLLNYFIEFVKSIDRF